VNSPLFLVMIGLAALLLMLALIAAVTAGPRPRATGPGAARALPEGDEALDAEDLVELLEVTNTRRRARGLAARTPEDLDREFG
jgi:hypothetical protein